MSGNLTIGSVARSVGCSVQTIRHYEKIGLLPSPPRSAGNQRLYDDADVRRLAFIRHARDLGFPLDAITDLLSLSDQPERSCEAVDAIAKAQLASVERRIAHLQALKVELSRMLKHSGHGRVADCRVIEVLGGQDADACQH